VQHAWSGLLAKQDVAGRSLSLLETTATRCSSYTCLLNRRRSTLCSPRTSTPLPRASTLPLRPPAFVCNWGDQAARRGRAAQPQACPQTNVKRRSLCLYLSIEKSLLAPCANTSAQRSAVTQSVSQPASVRERQQASCWIETARGNKPSRHREAQMQVQSPRAAGRAKHQCLGRTQASAHLKKSR